MCTLNKCSLNINCFINSRISKIKGKSKKKNQQMFVIVEAKCKEIENDHSTYLIIALLGNVLDFFTSYVINSKRLAELCKCNVCAFCVCVCVIVRDAKIFCCKSPTGHMK